MDYFLHRPFSTIWIISCALVFLLVFSIWSLGLITAIVRIFNFIPFIEHKISCRLENAVEYLIYGRFARVAKKTWKVCLLLTIPAIIEYVVILFIKG